VLRGAAQQRLYIIICITIIDTITLNNYTNNAYTHYCTELCYVELHNNVFRDLLVPPLEQEEGSSELDSMFDVGGGSGGVPTSSKLRSSAAFEAETKIQVHESKNMGVFLAGRCHVIELHKTQL
jgi:hypothetical protein